MTPASHAISAAHRIACLVCLLSVLLVAPGPAAYALNPDRPLAEFSRQSWQADAGLPQDTVRAILETRDGFLWLGTEGGLVRFDGVDFRVFDPSNTPAMRSGFVAGLAEDASGTLWIATSEGLLSERDGHFVHYGGAEGLPAEDVFAVCIPAGGGAVVALTPAGAASYERDRFRVLPGSGALGLSDSASLCAGNVIAGSTGILRLGESAPLRLPQVGQIQALGAGAAGASWVGGSAGLARFGSDHLPHNLLAGQDVTALLPSAAGLWVGTAKSLGLLRNPGAPREAFEEQPGFQGRRIDRLYLDREGALWAATDRGVARLSHGQVEFLSTLPHVLAISEDREGDMWFGTDSAGLSVLRERAFSTLTTEDGLSAGLVRSVFEDHAGTLWIGTDRGLDRLSGGTVQAFDGGRLPAVLAIAETPVSGDLWVGTPAGLVRISAGKAHVYTTADGLADDFVRSLWADRDGRLWIGTRNGLSLLESGRFRSWSTLDGLGSDLIGSILRTRDGTLWVGTLAGLSRMQNASFLPLPGASGAVTALLEDRRGTLWVATSGSGLGRVVNGRLEPLPTGAPLPAAIYGMVEDGSGNLWLSSRSGIDRVSIAALVAFARDPSRPLPVRSFGIADGLRIREATEGGHPAACRAQDGTLWFATLNGAASVRPDRLPSNRVPPPIAIEQVLVDGTPVEAAPSIRVPPGHGRLTLQYAGLSFVAPAQVRYRYQLEGFDRHWIDAGGRRTAYYTNIPPGKYRFLVEAQNNDSVWSAEPASLRFDVRPFFYQTVIFDVLAVLLLALAASAVYRWRVRTVAAGYHAVLDERGRIAREIHDTLAQGYVAISVQLDLIERLLSSSSAQAREQLRLTRAMVGSSLEEARSSIWNLRAQAEAETLPARLAEVVRRYSGQAGAASAAIRFSVHGTYRPLLAATEQELERIAQEALSNALKHSGASTIAVTLTYQQEELLLSVRDDGIGLPDIPAPPRHFGLQGMHERARRIHAILTLESSRGGPGTAVTVRLPLARDSEKAL